MIKWGVSHSGISYRNFIGKWTSGIWRQNVLNMKSNVTINILQFMCKLKLEVLNFLTHILYYVVMLKISVIDWQSYPSLCDNTFFPDIWWFTMDSTQNALRHDPSLCDYMTICNMLSTKDSKNTITIFLAWCPLKTSMPQLHCL